MSREEVQKLLGGYATGTLTAEEQRALFAAALEDQELFDQLAREQAVRDVLRDAAARAQLLAALDERPQRGFWGWLQPPVIAGLAMAGIAAIAVVAWKASQPAAAPVQVAMLKPPAPAESPRVEPPPQAIPPQSAATPPAVRHAELTRATPSKQTEGPRNKDKAAEVADAAQIALSAPPPPPVFRATPPPRPVPEAVGAAIQMQHAQAPPSASQAQQGSIAAGAIAATAQAPLPASQAQQGQIQDTRLRAEVKSEALDMAKTVPAESARQLFFGGMSGIAGNSFVPSGGGGGGGAASPTNASLPTVPGTAGYLAAATGGKGGVRLGVRCSLLRDGKEADLSTPLNAGESVKLHITPNSGGFLYLYEGEGAAQRLVASGPARSMQPFDTPELKSDSPGQKEYRVVLTRFQTTAASTGAIRGANLVEPAGVQDPGTYSVLRDATPSQPVFAMDVTLTWR